MSKSDDALQRRLSRFLAEVRTPRSFNGAASMGIGTSIGAVRDGNQDRALITLASYAWTPDRDFALGVVCDGIGGLQRGGDAAFWAVSVFVSRFLRTAKLETSERLAAAASAANDAVYELLRGRGGATLSAAVVDRQGNIFGVNVGDSRIYGITHSRALVQLSRDDTLAAVLGRPEELDQSNRLVQFIGMGEGIEPHPITPVRSNFESLLLTSDGAHGAPPEALTLLVRNAGENSEIIRRLIALSDVLGGRDNSTALILPTSLEPHDSDPEQGLGLTFLSPSARLEVWLPILAGEARLDRFSADLTEASSPPELSATKARSKHRRARREQVGEPPQKSASSSKSGRQSEPAELEHPMLDVHFPNRSPS
jgi:PPM family protein phosphatase